MELLKEATKIYNKIEALNKQIKQLKLIFEHAVYNDYSIKLSLPTFKNKQGKEIVLDENGDLKPQAIYASSFEEAQGIWKKTIESFNDLKKDVDKNTFNFNKKESLLIIAFFIRTKEDTRDDLIKYFNSLESKIKL